jgi:MFS family permease
MISHAGKSIGRGWVFGLNEALDQTGATVGPLIAALVLYLRGGYRHAFAALLISALLCLSVLIVARVLYPRPQELEQRVAKAAPGKGIFQTILDLLYRWSVDCGRLCRFRLDCVSFSKRSSGSAKHGPGPVCCSNGHGSVEFPGLRSTVGQIRPTNSSASIFPLRVICSFRLSWRIHVSSHRNGPVGNRLGSSGLITQSHPLQCHPDGEAEHGIRRV